jgi:hypothetical protein
MKIISIIISLCGSSSYIIRTPYHNHQEHYHDILKSRRDVVISSGSLLLSPLLIPVPIEPASAKEGPHENISPTREITKYIVNNANQKFLRSVADANYNFLYRGLSPNASKQLATTKYSSALIITNEPFDLLDIDTYGSEEAVAYFQSLEVQMYTNKVSIRPSNSHIGTTCPKEAAKWGTAVSIWPLGEHGVEFAWLEEGGLFWPVSSSHARAIVHSDGSSGLSRALQGNEWEIMFRANTFLAVPAALDKELRQLLRAAIQE